MGKSLNLSTQSGLFVVDAFLTPSSRFSCSCNKVHRASLISFHGQKQGRRLMEILFSTLSEKQTSTESGIYDLFSGDDLFFRHLFRSVKGGARARATENSSGDDDDDDGWRKTNNNNSVVPQLPSS